MDQLKTETRVQQPQIVQRAYSVIRVFAQTLQEPVLTTANVVEVKCAVEEHASPLLANARALGTVAPEWCVVRVSAVRLKLEIPVSGIKNVVLPCIIQVIQVIRSLNTNLLSK